MFKCLGLLVLQKIEVLARCVFISGFSFSLTSWVLLYELLHSVLVVIKNLPLSLQRIGFLSSSTFIINW